MDFTKIIDRYSAIIVTEDKKFLIPLEFIDEKSIEYYKGLSKAFIYQYTPYQFAVDFNTFGEVRPRQSGKTTQLAELADYCCNDLGYRLKHHKRNIFGEEYSSTDFYELYNDYKTIYLVSDQGKRQYQRIEENLRGCSNKLPPLIITISTYL